MKQFNWVTVLLLSIVTCGLYSLYVWHTMSTNNNAEAERLGLEKKMSFIVAFLLGMVTCGIVPLVWYFMFMGQQVQLAQKKGVKTAPTESSVVLALLMFVPVYGYYVLCDNYNRTIAA